MCTHYLWNLSITKFLLDIQVPAVELVCQEWQLCPDTVSRVWWQLGDLPSLHCFQAASDRHQPDLTHCSEDDKTIEVNLTTDKITNQQLGLVEGRNLCHMGHQVHWEGREAWGGSGTSDAHDGGAEERKWEPAPEPSHDDAIGLVPFGC